MTKDQLAFVARIAREYPGKSPLTVAEDSKRLFALGRKIQRLAENSCNGVPKQRLANGHVVMRWDEDDERKAEFIEGRIRVVIEKEMGYVVQRLSGDPRGCCLKLKLPSGYTDDWDNEGFCVPYRG